MSGGGNDDLDLCLPPEICIEILTRVPIKSILRFRSVCKPWLSLISSPDYFKPKTLSDRILLNRSEGRRPQVWSLTSHDLSFSESRDHRDDLRGRILNPIGSCHGLICSYNSTVDMSKEEDIYSFVIYNPAIRKTVELPSLSFGFRTHGPHYCGFGFDSKASDYKVMLILEVYSYVTDLVDETSYVGFMFDLRNGVWREFSPILPTDYYRSRMCGSKFYLNGAVHWVGYSDENVKVILSFDMSEEASFRVIPISMPEELSRGYRPLIMTSGGLIYAFGGRGLQVCSVWVMKEYGVTESWTKVFTIGMPPQFSSARVEALIFRGPPEAAAEVLLTWMAPAEFVAGKFVAGDGIKHLILHNIEIGESRCLLSTDKPISDLVFYKESLVLM